MTFVERYSIYLMIFVGGWLTGRHMDSTAGWLGAILALTGYVFLERNTKT